MFNLSFKISGDAQELIVRTLRAMADDIVRQPTFERLPPEQCDDGIQPTFSSNVYDGPYRSGAAIGEWSLKLDDYGS